MLNAIQVTLALHTAHTVNQSRLLPHLSVTKYVIAPPHTHAHTRHDNKIKGATLLFLNLSNCIQYPHTHTCHTHAQTNAMHDFIIRLYIIAHQ